MSVHGGYTYLKELAMGLWCQGFQRIIFVTGHGPAEMTIVPVIWDLFDETKHHFWWMDQMKSAIYASKQLDPARDGVSQLDKITLGCYEILGCKDDLVIDPNCAPPIHHKVPTEELKLDKSMLPESVKHLMHAVNFATFSDATGFYFGSIEDHGGDQGAFPSIEARDEACAEGLKQLRVCVDLMDMDQYVSDIKAQQEYTDTHIKSKYHHLPKNKFSNWN